MVGQLSWSSGRTNVQWKDVSVDCLKQMSLDVCDYLSHVPAQWSAVDLSRFCTDRDDWGILVSMWACLWGAVVKAKAYQGHRDELIALVASDEFRDAAQDHIQRYGAAAHVLILVKQFGQNGADLVARESQVDRLRARPGLVAGPRRRHHRSRSAVPSVPL